MPCIPTITAPWMNGKTNVLVKGQPALISDYKLMCMGARTNEVTNEGQK